MEQPAQPTRPKSAAGRPRLSRTRSYINSREAKASGKDEDENVPAPFLGDNTKAENGGYGDETAPLIFSLLGDLDDDGNVFQWETTRTVKPKNAFVHDMQFRFSLSNIERGDDSKLLCRPTRLDLKSFARGPIALISLLCQHMAALLMTAFGYFSRCGIKRCIQSSNDENMPCVSEEDGLVTKSIVAPTTAKSRNLLRLEDRIRRELAIETKPPPLAANLSDKSVAAHDDTVEIKDETNDLSVQRPVAKMDESFWMNPVNDLVGPEKSRGNVQREVNLTVDVGPIKLSQHPEFTAQEQELARLSCFSNISEEIQLTQPNQIAEGVETNRRKMDKYFARLMVNGHVVGDSKTEAVDLLSFSVKLSHRFNCKMSQKPTSTCVQVWRSAGGFLPNELVCSIGFLPDESTFTQEDQLGSSGPLEWLQFSSKGSDVKGVLVLRARIVEYTVKSSPHMANMSEHLPQLIRSPGGIETYNQHAAACINPSQHCSGLDRQSMMEFRHNSGILFTKIVLEEPLRHSLIKKRQKSPNSVLSPIPITELEVQNNDAYHELIKNDCPNEVRSSSSAAFSVTFIVQMELLTLFICFHKLIVHDVLKERPFVNKHHLTAIFRGFQEFKRLSIRRKHHVSEVIQDVGLFHFAASGGWSMPSLPRKRSLFPKSRQRLPVTKTSAGQEHAILLLTIVGGHNFPTEVERKKASADQENSLLTKEGNLPLVLGNDGEGVICKIIFRGKKSYTKPVFRSMSPQWKETLSLPLGGVLEGTPLISLHDEVISISLYDCATADMAHIGGFYEDEDTKSIEYRYLGHVSLPLCTVLATGTMHGFVQCSSPDFIVGFGESDDDGVRSIVERHQEPSANTMLQLHATIDPLSINPNQTGRPDYKSGESASIMSRVVQWSQLYLNHSADSVLWPDITGRLFLASRYLSQQAPPPGFNTINGCTNYVSLIPSSDSIDCKSLQVRDEHVVLTSDQVLSILSGTRREHAILLANFFLHLSARYPDLVADIFLVVGFAVPEGETTWVMRRCRQNSKVVFYDAMSGCAYFRGDVSCPLQGIHYLVSLDNVYANIRTEQVAHLLEFDLSNSWMWVPLLRCGRSGETANIMTVQAKPLQYTLPDNSFARQLQSEVCEALTSAIRGWRQVPTGFRPDLSKMLSSLLEKLEEAKLNNGHSLSTSGMTLPESITRGRRVFGFALHVPFTGMENLLERIKATDIHRNRSPRVEYAVAARVFAYHGGVLCVWIFVLSTLEK